MHLMYFTEQPMSNYPEDAVGDDGVTALMFSNSNFDPVAGSQLYNERLIEYQLVEEVGFDGIMLNEHHNAPFCMQAQITVWASILAAATERVKIVLLGTPLPTIENPVAISESLSMIDMISKAGSSPASCAARGPSSSRTTSTRRSIASASTRRMTCW